MTRPDRLEATLAGNTGSHLAATTYSASAVDGHMIASDLGRDLRRRC